MHAIILATLAAAVSARPSYIAVPADQIAFVDLSSLHVRVPRQTLTPPPLQNLYNQDYQPIPLQQDYQPISLQQYQQLQQIQQEPVAINPLPQREAPAPPRLVRLQQQPEDVAGAASLGPSQQLNERPPDFGEYVDFGAHTGDNGAFGWYADYPINNHDDHHGYRK